MKLEDRVDSVDEDVICALITYGRAQGFRESASALLESLKALQDGGVTRVDLSVLIDVTALFIEQSQKEYDHLSEHRIDGSAPDTVEDLLRLISDIPDEIV